MNQPTEPTVDESINQPVNETADDAVDELVNDIDEATNNSLEMNEADRGIESNTPDSDSTPSISPPDSPSGGGVNGSNESKNPPPTVVNEPKPTKLKGKKAWHREPKANFQLDSDGNVIIQPNGKPKRKKGGKRKAKIGDELADGSIFNGESTKPKGRPSKITVESNEPDTDDSFDDDEDIVDDVISVLPDGVKPDSTAHGLIKRGTEGTIGKMKIPAWGLLIAGFTLWGTSLLIRFKKARAEAIQQHQLQQEQESTNEGHQPHRDSGKESVGEDAGSQAVDDFGFPIIE